MQSSPQPWAPEPSHISAGHLSCPPRSGICGVLTPPLLPPLIHITPPLLTSEVQQSRVRGDVMGTADQAGGCQRIAGASETPGKGPSVVLGAPTLASLPLLP